MKPHEEARYAARLSGLMFGLLALLTVGSPRPRKRITPKSRSASSSVSRPAVSRTLSHACSAKNSLRRGESRW